MEQGVAVHVTWQVEWLVHDTDPDTPTEIVQLELSQSMLPLSPVVSMQVLEPLHAALHEPAQVAVQLLPSRQPSEQLPPVAVQPVACVPCQLHVAPA